MPKIKGGFYLKARCVQSSYIAHAPPCVREIWDWLLMKAFHLDGKDIKRGQLICTYKDIQEGLHWYVGYRKKTYSKWDCERTLKALMKATMIATTKTTRGLVVSIVNYAKYQDVKNYESHSESHNEATMKPQTTETIEEECNKNVIRIEKREGSLDWVRELPLGIAEELAGYYRVDTGFVISRANDLIDYCEAKGKRYSNYKAALRNFIKSEIARHPEAVKKNPIPTEADVLITHERTPEEQARINAKLEALRQQKELLAKKLT